MIVGAADLGGSGQRLTANDYRLTMDSRASSVIPVTVNLQSLMSVLLNRITPHQEHAWPAP